MKTSLLFTAFTVFTLRVFAQVPNGGFENWTAGQPDSWTALSIGVGPNTVTPHSPGYAGTYGAKGNAINVSGTTIGAILTSTDALNQGFPVSQNWGVLNFYYQSNLSAQSAFVAIISMEDATNTSIGAGGNTYPVSASSWTYATIPVLYNPGTAAECIITFALSNTGTLPLTDYFIVDEVTLSASVGLNENSGNAFLIENVSPNPATDHLSVYYSVPVQTNLEIILADISGRTVKNIRIENETSGKHKYIMDVNDVNSGSYLLTLLSDKGIHSQKIQIVK